MKGDFMNGKELLISALRLNFDNKHAATIKSEWRQGADFDALVCQAGVEKLTSLLHYTLKKAELLPLLPSRYQEELYQFYLKSFLRYTALFENYGQVLKALTQAGVEVLVFKGVALGETVYPMTTLRPMSDMDILVYKEDMEKVDEILLALNYNKRVARDGKAVEMLDYSVTYCSSEAQGLPNLDVHHVVPYLGYRADKELGTNVERVWKNAKGATILGCEVLTMSPADALLNLIGHKVIYHKNQIDVRFFCDLGFLISGKREELNWDYVKDIARVVPGASSFSQALEQMQENFNVVVPGDVLEAFKKAAMNDSSLRNFIMVRSTLFHGNMLDRLSESHGAAAKASALFHYLFPSKNYMRQAYYLKSETMLYLFYAWRPIQGFGKALTMVIKWLASSFYTRFFKSGLPGS